MPTPRCRNRGVFAYAPCGREGWPQSGLKVFVPAMKLSGSGGHGAVGRVCRRSLRQVRPRASMVAGVGPQCERARHVGCHERFGGGCGRADEHLHSAFFEQGACAGAHAACDDQRGTPLS